MGDCRELQRELQLQGFNRERVRRKRGKPLFRSENTETIEAPSALGGATRTRAAARSDADTSTTRTDTRVVQFGDPPSVLLPHSSASSACDPPARTLRSPQPHPRSRIPGINIDWTRS